MVHGNRIKKAISTVLFLCIALEGYVHFSYLFRNTGWSRYNITMFYEEPKDSLDVVFIGASNVFRYFDPLRAYSQEGFTSYDYAAENGLPMLTNAIADIKRTQSPRVMVVDPRFFISSRWENGLKLGFKNQLGSQDFRLLERMDAAMKYWYLGEESIGEAASVFLDLPIYHDNRKAFSDIAHWRFSNDNRGDPSLNSYSTEKGFLIPDAYQCEPFSNDILANSGKTRSGRGAAGIFCGEAV